MNVVVIIPVLNEEQSIGQVLDDIPKSSVREIIVVDNGSTDGTAEIARQHGARVVSEPQRGYGAACLAGIAAAPPADVLVFVDGDYSDYPEEMDLLIAPIAENRADMVIGSRVLGKHEKNALPSHAQFGNALASFLIRILFGVRYTDLGPFRAIRRSSLDALGMADRNYGWTVEMQVKAAKAKLRIVEVPVSYRARIGKSKVSGTISGSFKAGVKILFTIFRLMI